MSLAAHRFPAAPAPRSARRAGLLAAVALHAAAGAAVLAYEPARTALAAPAAIAVEWITAPRLEEPVAAPQPAPAPKPRVARHKPSPATEPTPLAAAPAPSPEPAPAVEPITPPPAAQVASIAEPTLTLPPLVTPPIFNANYLANPPPPYPALSRRTGEQGRVVLRVHVTPAGTVDDLEVRSSSGHPRLDDSAVQTVKRWKFVPAKRGAEPIAAWVLVPISFGLES